MSDLVDELGVFMSSDAHFYLRKLMEVLQLPVLFPRYKDEYEVLFKRRENIGLIIDEWRRCVSRIDDSSAAHFLPVLLSRKTNVYSLLTLVCLSTS